MISFVTFHKRGILHLFRRWNDGYAECWCGYVGKPVAFVQAKKDQSHHDATCATCRERISQVKIVPARTRKEQS